MAEFPPSPPFLIQCSHVSLPGAQTLSTCSFLPSSPSQLFNHDPSALLPLCSDSISGFLTLPIHPPSSSPQPLSTPCPPPRERAQLRREGERAAGRLPTDHNTRTIIAFMFGANPLCLQCGEVKLARYFFLLLWPGRHLGWGVARN